VEKLTCIKHIQIFTDERYLVDLYVQVGVGRWYDMLLSIVELDQQHVELHGPNKMWVNCNIVIMILQ
jgi:hypothetical protein